MAADGTPGAKGNPQYLGGGAPATAADQNEISTWAANNIDRRVADNAARDAIVFKYVGMVVQTADTNTVWLCSASGGAGTWLVIREDTGWQTPTLQGSPLWVPFGSGFRSPAYRRFNGKTELRGTVKSGVGVIFTLPPTYRPSATEAFNVLTNVGSGDLRVNTDGTITIAAYISGGNNGIVSLAGINFTADA